MKRSICVLLFSVSTTVAMSQLYIPNGTSGITSSSNSNYGIDMAPTSYSKLTILSGSLAPLEMRTDQSVFSFAGHTLSLEARPTFANVPYIEWRTSNDTRQAYLGWNPDVFTLKLDNGFNFLIDNGKVGVGTSTPVGTLDVKVQEVATPNSENAILNLLSRPGTGMVDNLFQFNQAVGDDNMTTFAVFRMGNQFTNDGVPDEIVLSANGNSWLNSGNVGIGTTTPLEKLQIGDRWTFHNGGDKIIGYNFDHDGGPKRIVDDQAAAIRLTGDGRIRFDVAPSGTPGSNIEFTTALNIQNNGDIVWGNGSMLKTAAGGSMELGSSGTPYIDFRNDLATDYDARFMLYDDNTLVLAGANLLMGKTSQTNTSYKIDVDGKIRANEIVVNTDGADYVFDPDYKLRSLVELEKFIKENRHLPGIPNAKDMQRDGMAVAETTTKLLEKIEELTLYVIDLEKRNSELQEDRKATKALNAALLTKLEHFDAALKEQQRKIDELEKLINEKR